jgi:hypothetical protein
MNDIGSRQNDPAESISGRKTGITWDSEHVIGRFIFPYAWRSFILPIYLMTQEP